MANIELISVHVPKCAGTSLRGALARMFGHEAVYHDYGDRPIDPASPMNLDPDGFYERMGRSGFKHLAGKRAVHGHFNIGKYRNFSARLRITFVREPIDRMISHYFFWKDTRPNGHSLHEYVFHNDIDIENFARLPLIRRFYTASIFAGVDMKQFDLIGFHDRLSEDFVKLQQLMGTSTAMDVENAGTAGHYHARRHATFADAALMGRLRDLLRDDLAFYEKLRA
ncbi:MAG: sulfotransferase family 2 domain-containing protein [Rhodospirillales bacterium]